MAAPVKVEITGEAKGLFDTLEKSSGAMKGFAREVEAHTAGIGKIVDNLKAPFIALAGVVGGGAFLKSTVEATKDWTVESIKLSRVLGVSTESASAWAVAIHKVHGDTETFIGLAAKLPRTINTNEAAFKRFGVEVRDGNGSLRPMSAILLDVNDKLMHLKEGTDRNVAGAALFGRGWVEVQKYLRIGRDELQDAAEEAKRLGLEIGPNAVESVKAYRKAHEDLDLTLKALKFGIGMQLIPTLTAFNDIMKDLGGNGVSIIGGSFKALFQSIYWGAEGVAKSISWIKESIEVAISANVLATSAAKQLLSGHLDAAKGHVKAFQASITAIHQQAEMERLAIHMDFAVRNAKLNGAHGLSEGDGDDVNGKAHKDAKPKANVYAEELARLEKERAVVGASLNATAKEEAEWRKLQADHEERLAKWTKDVHAGTLKPEEAKALASKSADLLEAQEKALRAKEAQEEEQQNQQLFEIRKERRQAHRIALLDMDKADIQRRKELGQISESQALMQIEDLEEKRYQIEVQGLKDRLAVQTLEVKERAKIISQLQALEDKRQAGREESGAQIATARITENSQTTVKGGIQAQIKENQKSLREWGTMARDVMAGVENAFASGVKGILSGQMTLGQGLKTIWSGIADTILNALSQMAAKYVVTALANMLFGEQTAVASNTVAGAHEVAAAAGFFEAYAAIPYVGLALAEGNIAVMEATMGAMRAKQVVGAAEGGWFDRPTLTMIGEGKRPELVVPDTSFQDFARNLVANILRQERQAQAYRSQAAGYARHPRAAAPAGVQHLHNYAGATIVAMDNRQWEDTVARAQRGYDRRKN